MNLTSEIETIVSKQNYLEKGKLWGRYYLGEYYFVINTNKTKKELGLIGVTEIPRETQIQLQYDNFPAIFHEYIHYVHEVSTLIGSLSLFLEVLKRSLFSNFFDNKLKSSEFLGFDFKDKIKVEKLSKILVTESFISGDNNSRLEGCIFIQPLKINKAPTDVYFPYLDGFTTCNLNQIEVAYEFLFNGEKSIDKLYFGKYFIYEGLAYELDRLVDKQVFNRKNIDDNFKGTEYTILRSISRFLFNEIDAESYLSIASLSLSYINSGETFVHMIENLKQCYENEIPQSEGINHLVEETRKLLLSKIDVFEQSQIEIKNVFKGRERLHKSFSFLTEQYTKSYLYRSKFPIFEVEKVLSGEFRKIVDIIPLCDFIYEFTDANEFNRDFIGTTLDHDASDSLKALLSYSHYFRSHSNFQSTKSIESIKTTSCPFYTCCQLQLRISNNEVCKYKPWRIFEISANLDNQFCWYGQGVLEFKGPNKLI